VLLCCGSTAATQLCYVTFTVDDDDGFASDCSVYL